MSRHDRSPRRCSGPATEVEHVVDRGAQVRAERLGRVELHAEGHAVIRGPALADASVGAERRPERAAGPRRRQESLEDAPHSMNRAADLRPRAGERRRRRDVREQQRPDDGHDDEHVPPRRYSPEIDAGSPIRRRTQSACSSSVWKRTSRNRLASEKTTMKGELVASGQRHVGDEQQADDDHGRHRASMPEGGMAREQRRAPHEQSEDQQVVAVLHGRERPARTRSLEAPTTASVVAWNRTAGDAPSGTSTQPTSRAISNAAKAARRDASSSDPSRRRAHEPDHDPADHDPRQEVGDLVATEDEQGVIERPGQGGAHEQDESEGQPGARPPDRQERVARIRPRAASREELAERPPGLTVQAELVLGQGVAEGASALGVGSSPAGSDSGRPPLAAARAAAAASRTRADRASRRRSRPLACAARPAGGPRRFE